MLFDDEDRLNDKSEPRKSRVDKSTWKRRYAWLECDVDGGFVQWRSDCSGHGVSDGTLK